MPRKVPGDRPACSLLPVFSFFPPCLSSHSLLTSPFLSHLLFLPLFVTFLSGCLVAISNTTSISRRHSMLVSPFSLFIYVSFFLAPSSPYTHSLPPKAASSSLGLGASHAAHERRNSAEGWWWVGSLSFSASWVSDCSSRQPRCWIGCTSSLDGGGAGTGKTNTGAGPAQMVLYPPPMTCVTLYKLHRLSGSQWPCLNEHHQIE